jgi:hypothetical protein
MTTDMTRWNRAGLSRFQYVDANAVTMLEDLRDALDLRWPGGVWASDPGQPPQARYQSPPREFGWQLSRVLARACHILLGYIEAYANEGFLPTATQWENVRRLVAMLGYRPAPPASASTPLVLELKPGLSGTVTSGLAVRHAPPGGGPPVVFETLADLEADAALNAVHLQGHGVSETPLAGSTLTLESVPSALRTGEPVVLESREGASSKLAAHMVSGVQGGTITLAQPIGEGFVAGRTLVHALPADRLALKGPVQGGSAQLTTTLQLKPGSPAPTPGELVIVSDGVSTVYARVSGYRDSRVVLDRAVGVMNLENARISRPLELAITGYAPARQTQATGAVLFLAKVAGDWSRLRGATLAAVLPSTIVTCDVTAADYTPPGTPVTGKGQMVAPGFTTLTLQVQAGSVVPMNPQKLFAPPPTLGPWSLDPQLQRQPATTEAGTPARGRGTLPAELEVARPKHAGPGDVVVMVRRHQLAWGKLTGVDQLADGTTAALRTEQPLQEVGGGAYYLSDSTVFAGFKAVLRPADWQLNARAAGEDPLTLETPATGLRPGRSVVVSRTDAADVALATTVVKVSDDARSVWLDDRLPAGSTVGNVEIAANVVLAGHGSRRNAVMLGSGDATQARQSFPLNVTDVSWVADRTMPAGVRADIEVRVAGEPWRQVGTLDDSGPADGDFEVHVREDGGLQLVFGDGGTGRRLPTGVNNVVAGYRAGVGLAGNLPAGSLTALVTPHPLVGAVSQPLEAAGGSDLEPATAMRAAAPATVLTLGRAVSLSDFAFLAARQSSVWQAKALPAVEAGRRESVTVVIVPAGGGTLTPTLRDSIQDFLIARALPGVTVKALPYHRVAFSISVQIRTDPQRFEPAVVTAGVIAALREAFTLPRRALGQSVHRSEVFRVVESVAGVIGSECWIGAGLARPVPETRVQRLPATATQVLELSDASTLDVTVERLG